MKKWTEERKTAVRKRAIERARLRREKYWLLRAIDLQGSWIVGMNGSDLMKGYSHPVSN